MTNYKIGDIIVLCNHQETNMPIKAQGECFELKEPNGPGLWFAKWIDCPKQYNNEDEWVIQESQFAGARPLFGLEREIYELKTIGYRE